VQSGTPFHTVVSVVMPLLTDMSHSIHGVLQICVHAYIHTYICGSSGTGDVSVSESSCGSVIR
jgi:hypothetical protein